MFQARAEKCCVCQAVIEGTYYTLHDETYCEEHYKEKVEHFVKFTAADVSLNNPSKKRLDFIKFNYQENVETCYLCTVEVS
jgi:hypothetical protein